MPGVYVSVSKKNIFCFIDWATKCKHGNKYSDFYNEPKCNDWANEFIGELSEQPGLIRIINKVKALSNSCTKATLNVNDFGKRSDMPKMK